MVNSDGYDLDKLCQMSKDEVIQWYFTEMKRLFPNAKAFVDYGIKDAERAYKELHDGTELVHNFN